VFVAELMRNAVLCCVDSFRTHRDISAHARDVNCRKYVRKFFRYTTLYHYYMCVRMYMCVCVCVWGAERYNTSNLVICTVPLYNHTGLIFSLEHHCNTLLPWKKHGPTGSAKNRTYTEQDRSKFQNRFTHTIKAAGSSDNTVWSHSLL
jgi:hypothetical protein